MKLLVVAWCVTIWGMSPGGARAAGPTVDPDAVKALGPWFQTLGDKGDPSRIAWWGDSAIVGDGYTGRVRERLQAVAGKGGPGFMLVQPTFDGYLRDGVRMKRQGWDAFAVIAGDVKAGNYGYGGVIATSYGGASSTFDSDTPVASVAVHYQAVPKGGKLELYVDGATKPTEVLETASSATKDAVWRPALAKPASSIKLRAGGGGVVKVYGVALEAGPSGVVLDALGILGIRARRWLNADADHLEGQVAARAPDLIVVNFGGNERVDEGLSIKAHTDDLTKALAALRAGAPKAACLIVGPLAHGTPGGGAKLDPALDTLYAAQRKVAKAEGCAFFDTLAVMGGAKAPKVWHDKKWISGDYAHLTPKGHDHLGDLMADWLLAHHTAWKATN